MTEKATARVRAMMVAYRALAGRVFGSPRLADTLLWSILLFATGTWSACTPTVLRCFNTAYMRVLRKCAGGCLGADAELRAELGVPSIPTLLRRERLRYASRPSGATATQCSSAECGRKGDSMDGTDH